MAALLASPSAPGKAAAYARRLSNFFFADSSEDDSSSDEDTVAAAHLRQRPLSLAILVDEDTTGPLAALHKELLASPSARLSNLFFADSSEEDSKGDEDTVAAVHPLSLARLLYGDTLDEDSKINLLLALADQEGGAASRIGGVSPRGWWVSKADGDAGDGDKGSARYSYGFVVSFQAFKMDQIKAEMNNGLSAPHSSFGISGRAAHSSFGISGRAAHSSSLFGISGRAAHSSGSFCTRRSASYSTSAAAAVEDGKAAAGGGGPGGGGGDGPTDCGARLPDLNPGGRAPDLVALMRRIEDVRAEALRNHARNQLTLISLSDELRQAKSSYSDAASKAARQVGVVGFRMCVGLGCFSFLSMVYYINQFGKLAQPPSPAPPPHVVVVSSTPPPPPPTTSAASPPPLRPPSQ